MASTGPITRDTSSLALGLAQIRVGPSATHIGNPGPVLVAADSIGAMATTKFIHEIEQWRHSSGFPMLEDYTIALRGTAKLECAFEEISPKTLALAVGIDATSGYTAAHSGEVALGQLTAPAYLRMEAMYTFPNGTNFMHIIFPRAQVSSSPEVDMQKEDIATIPATFEAKRADAEISGGNAIWNDKPLGRIQFA